MSEIVAYFQSLEINLDHLWKYSLTLLVGTLVLACIGRFAFGKKSALSCAVSSAIAILFVYAVTVVLQSFGAQFEDFLAPLPFVNITAESLAVFNFTGAHYTVICSELLSMIILAFLVNLADGWLPNGKNIFSWVFFRCMTVVLAMVLHWVVIMLFKTYLPEGIVIYAPTVLLALLILMLCTGALKIVVGTVLSISSPIIGGLYTFFFATIIGKQISKAVLTTVILVAIVFALNYFGCAVISIASSALIAYIPFVILLVALWYMVKKLL